MPKGTPCIAIAPYNDKRVQQIRGASRTARYLLGGFVNILGNRVKPSALIIGTHAPNSVDTAEAILAFRNIVAIAALLRQWSTLRPPMQHFGPLFSDSFDTHPAVLGQNDGIVVRVPGYAHTISGSQVQNFHGQVVPHIFRLGTAGSLADQELLSALIRVWQRQIEVFGFRP